jgi:hypothetical protein
VEEGLKRANNGLRLPGSWSASQESLQGAMEIIVALCADWLEMDEKLQRFYEEKAVT